VDDDASSCSEGTGTADRNNGRLQVAVSVKVGSIKYSIDFSGDRTSKVTDSTLFFVKFSFSEDPMGAKKF
jgi:hypothetical protein